jgi:hypothetical protein
MVLAATISFAESAFAPLAVGFFGLGTGYLIYGPQELFGLPARNRRVDITTGLWGIWMPGFMQFLTGVWLFVGLTWFDSFRAPPLYMAALAFTAYGVHWFAIGMGRTFAGDPRPNAFMCVAFGLISALGIVVFFDANDAPVGGLFIGLTCIYVADFVASFFAAVPPPAPATAGGAPLPVSEPVARQPVRSPIGVLGERALGFFHLGTGLWLMYLTWATALNLSNGFDLPL